MDDVWSVLEEESKKRSQGLTHKKKILKGIYCFELVKVYPTEKIENMYERADKSYLNLAKKKKNKPVAYNMTKIDVRAKYWYSEALKGELVRLNMTHKILVDMAKKRSKLKEYGCSVPNLILYWKPNKITVKYTFITQEEFSMYEKYLMDYDLRVLNYEFYWLGFKERYNELMFVAWFGVLAGIPLTLYFESDA